MITLFILFLIVFGLGYLVGYTNGKTIDLIDAGKAVVQMIAKEGKDIIIPAVKPGIIRRPNAKQLQDREIPKNIKEGREAMRETLDKIPELQEHKEALKKIEEMQP